MEGIAETMNDEAVIMTPEVKKILTQASFPESIRESLKAYFSKLDGFTPTNLYEMVISEVEKPLIEMVLQLTSKNQTKAAKVLGISRGTLRKKMSTHQVHNDN